MKLEIACFDLLSAKITAKSVADRIEFCAGLNQGGTTPDVLDFIELKKQCSMPVYIMIRPRGGNFVYTTEELKKMRKSIEQYNNLGADGFVFGVLSESGRIDREACSFLMQGAPESQFSFHRAIDYTKDIYQSVEEIIKLGFSTVLTSGGKQNAMEGLGTLEQLQHTFGEKIDIMPGGGVRSSNIHQIAQATGSRYYHSSAIPQGEKVSSAEEIFLLKEALKALQ